mgnify:CR=1 FL=1
MDGDIALCVEKFALGIGCLREGGRQIGVFDNLQDSVIAGKNPDFFVCGALGKSFGGKLAFEEDMFADEARVYDINERIIDLEIGESFYSARF